MNIKELQIGNFVMLGDNIYKIDEISANGWILISEIKTNMGLTTTNDIHKYVIKWCKKRSLKALLIRLIGVNIEKQ